MRERITKLRKARGWSMRDLAHRVNSSASTINDIEKGKTQITLTWMERLARAFEISVEELAGFEGGFVHRNVDEVVPFQKDSRIVGQIQLRKGQELYEVKVSFVDQVRIYEGSVVVVDTLISSFGDLATGDIVLGRHQDDFGTRLILREFVLPSLLITNSRGTNLPSINLYNAPFDIVGLVVSSVSEFRAPRHDIEDDIADTIRKIRTEDA
jgi:transcriptional regulator with XRE-family HTH domain